MDATAVELLAKVSNNDKNQTPLERWNDLTKILSPKEHSFDIHSQLYNEVYKDCPNIKPSWIPNQDELNKCNIGKVMSKLGMNTYEEFYNWSIGIDSRNDFWRIMSEEVDIKWNKKPTTTFDLSDKSDKSDKSNGNNEEKIKKDGIPHATYFPNGKLNIANSCFLSHNRPEHEPALVYAMESDPTSLQIMTYTILNKLSNQIANAIHDKMNLACGDAIGICMPMTPESVAIYLGIVKAGCVVVSIADSFSADEIEMRCRLSNAKAIFTQDVIYRGSKFLPLYTRIQSHSKMGHLKVAVLPGMLHAGPYPKLSAMKRSPSGTWDDRDAEGIAIKVHDSVMPLIRSGIDYGWHDFLHQCSDEYTAVIRDAMDPCNILFSSGTTGEPKAIVWSHSTPIKCAIDGYLHQDIREGENVVWPTNIGWMMGPFILFQLINGATIGIFNGITSTNAFCEYVEVAQMSMVGVIPSLVKAWQATGATNNCDWSCVRRFSSTGEASDPNNMLWLMSRVPGYAPVIEYCGGTEIGGSYMSSTLMQPNVPSMFSSPVLGSQLVLLDSNGNMQEGDGYTNVSRKNSSEDTSTSTSTNTSTNTRARGRSYSGIDMTSKSQATTTIVGELTIVPPCLGLSTHLLNRDHYECYYGGMPVGTNGEVLRRHGDEVELIREGQYQGTGTTNSTTNTSGSGSRNKGGKGSYYRALGRCDDTMNLGGIKISSVEIERVCNTTEGIHETAAIAYTPPLGGPSLLLLFIVVPPPVGGAPLPPNAHALPPVDRVIDAATMSMKDLLNSQSTTSSSSSSSNKTGTETDGSASTPEPTPEPAPEPAPAAIATATLALPQIDEINKLKASMQISIKTKLNPLFHIYKVIATDKLPRTASNKIMRRVLRDQYVAKTIEVTKLKGEKGIEEIVTMTGF